MSILISRYALAFILSAPFFMAGVTQTIGIVNDVDMFLCQYGASTYQARAAIGQGTKETINSLAKIGVENVTPSSLGEKLDVLFINSDFKGLLSVADPVVAGFENVKSSLLGEG